MVSNSAFKVKDGAGYGKRPIRGSAKSDRVFLKEEKWLPVQNLRLGKSMGKIVQSPTLNVERHVNVFRVLFITLVT